ncbi:L-xylulose reductase [Operophtera brumata]|uniref:L-xylulose reductase n=1 Tax=Operophtera brumata TaxID=104452 RepID=A0A0L7LCK1_OPEBR|nr:L-xylulose reductase [Operophtera brumata]
MEISFKGKRILVTGAGQGIGRGIAVELWRAGANIVALSRTRSHLETLHMEYPSIEIVDVDIADWEKTRKVVESLGHFDALVNNAAIAKEYPSIQVANVDLRDWNKTKEVVDSLGVFDALVNNAGIAVIEPFLECSAASFDEIISVNVRAILNVSQVVAKKMIQNNIKGSIVNISSQASMAALKDHVAYCASKGAVDSMTRVMALELGEHGIRVNTVNPTVIMTEMGRKVWSEPAKSKGMLSKIPLGSSDASMISGVQLPVDGGFLAT